jgi:hypothetical protein
VLGLAALGSAGAAAVPCDGGFCRVADGNSILEARAFSVPGVGEDGFGFKVKTPGGAGLKVDGLDVLFAQGHWFRIEGGARGGEIGVGGTEHQLDGGADDAVLSQDAATKEIVLHYSGSGYPLDIELRYRLRAGAPHSFASSLDYSATLTNRADSALDVQWFIYQDLDLNTVSDNVRAAPADGSAIRQATECRSFERHLKAVDTVAVPPGAYNLAVFGGRTVARGGAPSLPDLLSDGQPTRLADLANVAPDVNTDMTNARQYALHLLRNQPVLIRGTLDVTPFAKGDLDCGESLDYAGDFPAFLRSFGKRGFPGVEPDYDGDGVVGLSDYSIFRSLFH